jgi:phosphatidylglycerophosphate synthase
MRIVKVSIAEIRATYPKEKMLFEKRARIWLYYTGRLPSFYVAWLFLRLNISANHATYFSLIVGLIGCMFLISSSYIVKLVGAVMINLVIVLDCVDGSIARYRKSFTRYGELIDALVGYVVTAFLFMSLGVGVFLDPDSSLLLRRVELFPFFTREIFLFAGLWSSLAYVLGRLISLRYRTIFTSVPSDNNTEIAVSSRFIGTRLIMTNLFGLSGLFMPLLLLAIIFKLLGSLVLFYAVVNTCGLIIVTVRVIWKASRASRQKII